MPNHQSSCRVCVVAAAAISCAAYGDPPGQETEIARELASLRREIATLRAEKGSQWLTEERAAELLAEVASLKSQNGDIWLTKERAAEIQSLIKDMLADSETRTSLQSTAATSGYNNGFFIASADGNFRLNVSFLGQIRFTYDSQGSNPATVNNQEWNNSWGFDNRRTAMVFSGNVVDPSWTYAVRVNYASNVDPYTPTDGVVILQDAWVAKDFGSGFSFKVGQFKSPFMAESLRNDGAQLTAERSVVDYYFSGGYTQGVAVNYSSDQFRATGSYNNGPRAQNGCWYKNNTNSISLAGRFEFKAMGAWSQFDSESSATSDESALRFGAAIQYYNNRGGPADKGWAPSVSSPVYGVAYNGGFVETTTGAIDWTVDGTFESGGMTLSAAFVGANYGEEPALAGPVTKLNSYGMVVQGGYRFTDILEGFGRWEWVNVANGAKSPGSTVIDATDVNNFLTFGVNAYLGASVKWTTQFGISLSDVGSGINLYGAGYKADNNTNATDQFNIISQLQLVF